MKISKIEKHFSGFSLCIENFSLAEGKISGLIGPNGCGKTTLIKLLAGVLLPDSGEIAYGSLTDRDITMVSRKPYLMRDTVYNNLIYPLKLRKMPLDKEMLSYYLSLSGLLERKEAQATTLSSGEQQKLALVRALAFRPRVILLDEAFANMDMESILTFEALLKREQQARAMTLLIVSHQIPHIQRLCEWVYFMHGGKIQACGLTEQLLHSQRPDIKQYLRQETIVLRSD